MVFGNKVNHPISWIDLMYEYVCIQIARWKCIRQDGQTTVCSFINTPIRIKSHIIDVRCKYMMSASDGTNDIPNKQIIGLATLKVGICPGGRYIFSLGGGFYVIWTLFIYSNGKPSSRISNTWTRRWYHQTFITINQ